jgi:single-strand DNA-binding protein
VYVTEVVVENFALLESRAVTEARPSEPAGSNPQAPGQGNFGGGNQFSGQSAPNFGNQQPQANRPAPQSQSNFQQPAANSGANNTAAANSSDPFADNGQPIDISDDDLPF